MKTIEERVTAIEQRNDRVEIDKSWETSTARTIIIAFLTYIVIVLFFIVANLPRPLINSLVPTTGFVLSTRSLPLFKCVWVRWKKK